MAFFFFYNLAASVRHSSIIAPPLYTKNLKFSFKCNISPKNSLTGCSKSNGYPFSLNQIENEVLFTHSRLRVKNNIETLILPLSENAREKVTIKQRNTDD